MSKLTELIEELCPDWVEYRPLGELGKRNKGMVITASRMKELHHEGGEVRIFAGGYTIADVDRADLPGEAVIDVPSIIVKSRGNIGFEYHTRPFTHKNELWSYTLDDPDVDQKFIFYYLQSRVSYFQLKAKSGKLPQIGVRDTDQFSVPAPPLKVQREIVRVLDAFADLEQSLVSERELRKKQYEFYRDELLSFTANGGELCSDEVEYRPLGELLAIRDSERRPVTKSDRVPGPYPYYGANGIQDYVNEYIFDGEFILLGEDGSVLTDDFRPVTTWAAGKIWVNNHAHVIAAKSDEINLRFSYYALTSTDIRQFVSGGSRAKLNQSGLRLIPLPVPPLEIQQEIVAKLDTFQALIDSIEHEISLRRKQYEFYRDELLSFTPKED